MGVAGRGAVEDGKPTTAAGEVVDHRAAGGRGHVVSDAVGRGTGHVDEQGRGRTGRHRGEVDGVTCTRIRQGLATRANDKRVVVPGAGERGGPGATGEGVSLPSLENVT